jgi:hypothetical protein
MSSETKSGMTVIRIAFTQSPPTGSIQPTTDAARPVSAGDRMSPMTSPVTKPMRTRMAKDIGYTFCE